MEPSKEFGSVSSSELKALTALVVLFASVDVDGQATINQ